MEDLIWVMLRRYSLFLWHPNGGRNALGHENVSVWTERGVGRPVVTMTVKHSTAGCSDSVQWGPSPRLCLWIFWDVTSCNSIHAHTYFGGIYWLHLQGWKENQETGMKLQSAVSAWQAVCPITSEDLMAVILRCDAVLVTILSVKILLNI